MIFLKGEIDFFNFNFFKGYSSSSSPAEAARKAFAASGGGRGGGGGGGGDPLSQSLQTWGNLREGESPGRLAEFEGFAFLFAHIFFKKKVARHIVFLVIFI